MFNENKSLQKLRVLATRTVSPTNLGVHPELICYGLNVKVLPQTQMAWSPSGGAVSKGCANFRRWEIPGGSRVTQAANPWGVSWLILVLLSLLLVYQEMKSSFYYDVLPLTPSGTVSQNNNFSL